MSETDCNRPDLCGTPACASYVPPTPEEVTE